jgi:hypothetical protein
MRENEVAAGSGSIDGFELPDAIDIWDSTTRTVSRSLTPALSGVTSLRCAGNSPWLPDAFVGTMAQLLCAVEENAKHKINGEDNPQTIAAVDARHRSAKEGWVVMLAEVVL